MTTLAANAPVDSTALRQLDSDELEAVSGGLGFLATVAAGCAIAGFTWLLSGYDVDTDAIDGAADALFKPLPMPGRPGWPK